MEEEKWVIDKENDNKYSRGYHSKLSKLNDSITRFYEDTDVGPIELNTIVTTSGMHAITIAIDSAIDQYRDCNLIFGNELYCDSTTTLRCRQRVKHFPVDVSDMDSIGNLFQELAGQNIVLFIESCSNPSGKIFDFRMIPHFRSLAKSLVVIVDNTWLTHVIFNPFEYDVDVVVSSLTKYYSAGTIIGGAYLVRKQHENLFDKAFNLMRWIHISGYDCAVISDNLPSMSDRLAISSNLTLELLRELSSLEESRVIKLTHPALEYHPSHELTKVFFKRNSDGELLYPSCFTFNFLGPSMNKFRKVMKTQAALDYITSFGCPMSRVDPFPQRDKIDKSIRVRFAVGYRDNVSRIVSGLNDIFGQL